MAVDAAGGDEHALAGDDLRGRADDDADPRLNVRVAGLADAGNPPALDTDVGLDDAPMVQDQGIGDDGIGHLRRGSRDCPIPSRMTLPPPNLTSSP